MDFWPRGLPCVPSQQGSLGLVFHMPEITTLPHPMINTTFIVIPQIRRWKQSHTHTHTHPRKLAEPECNSGQTCSQARPLNDRATLWENMDWTDFTSLAHLRVWIYCFLCLELSCLGKLSLIFPGWAWKLSSPGSFFPWPLSLLQAPSLGYPHQPGVSPSRIISPLLWLLQFLS